MPKVATIDGGAIVLTKNMPALRLLNQANGYLLCLAERPTTISPSELDHVLDMVGEALEIIQTPESQKTNFLALHL